MAVARSVTDRSPTKIANHTCFGIYAASSRLRKCRPLKVEHHKTSVDIWHPLEEVTGEGVLKFYADAEEVLQHLPRRGVPLVLVSKARRCR